MMKYILATLSLCVIFYSYSQNTFPTNGKVGINTTTPSARLDVNGNMKIDSSLHVKDSVVIDKDLRTKGKFVVEDQAYFLEKVTMNEKLILNSNLDANENVDVEDNLKVGNQLEVSGTVKMSSVVKMTGLAGINNGNNPNLEFLTRTPNGEVKTFGIGDLIDLIEANQLPAEPAFCLQGNVIQNPYWENGPNKLFVRCPQINVGIGTNNPEFQLHVTNRTYTRRLSVGTKNAPTNAVISAYTQYGNVSKLLQIGVGTNPANYESRFEVFNDGHANLTNAGGQTAFTINNGSGNAIEIYDNSGGKILQLENNGLLRSREIKVDLATNWPDYVFTDGYNLMTLNELAKYINTHHHLPGVPTSREIKEQGLGIGEIQRVQMEKIEEQTLYTIQLKKEVDELKNENDELRCELDQMKAELAEIKEMLNR